jgi:hypothetical protein
MGLGAHLRAQALNLAHLFVEIHTSAASHEAKS